MKRLPLLLLPACAPALAGVIGGPADHMGPMVTNMGPMVDHRYLPAAAAGASAPKLGATPSSLTPTASTQGSFRTTCGVSHMAHDDPIVFPGQPGATHLHVFFGNTGANAFSTAESIANEGNSTCSGGILNRTAYWVPALIDTRTAAPIVPMDLGVYYKNPNGAAGQGELTPFPAGLRMIAGNSKAVGPQSSVVTKWQCLSYGGVTVTNNMVGPSIPSCPIGSKLQNEVLFPMCWNGVDLDSPDHKSHVRYSVSNVCPTTHPFVLPQITLNIHYVVGDWNGFARLSSDMYDPALPSGYSAHGDWWGGWREIAESPDPQDHILSRWFMNCNVARRDCHADGLGDGESLK
jgi:uncharacterized protein DUF1996